MRSSLSRIDAAHFCLNKLAPLYLFGRRWWRLRWAPHWARLRLFVQQFAHISLLAPAMTVVAVAAAAAGVVSPSVDLVL
jgi:hypothetical protein